MNEFALPENLARDLYRQQGADTERQRIIALLEADMGNIKDGKCIMTNHYPESCHCEIIALIKGEQK